MSNNPKPNDTGFQEPATELLDVRGYRCPVPVIKMEAALRKLPLGTLLRVLADDPIAAIDIPHFCREAGYSCRRDPDLAGACVFTVTRAQN